MRLDARPKVHPSDVRGMYRDRRKWMAVLLVAFFLSAPWINIDGWQLLHVDLTGRVLTVLGVSFYAHEVPALLLLAMIFLFAVAWVTAVFGRVWCGWVCPETVFTEFVFRRIERWIEGDGLTRRKLDAAPWTVEKALKKGFKWALFYLLGVVIAATAVRFFVDGNPVDPVTGAPRTVVALGAFFAFAFGWLREGFCIAICPYGRLQSLMIDEHTLNVAYDTSRSDCIDCNRCVQVCPTGIDIRKGLQLECVACTSCADACDAVMAKIRKPSALIGYRARVPGAQAKWARPRPVVYLALLAAFSSALAVALLRRPDIASQVVRARGAPYEVVEQGATRRVVNRFVLDLRNQTRDERTVEIQNGDGAVEVVSAAFPLVLRPGELRRAEVFVTFDPERAPEGRLKANLRILARDLAPIETELSLVGPYGRATF